MQAAARLGATGQRDIQRLFGQTGFQRRLADCLATLVERGLDSGFRDIDRGAGGFLLLGRQFAKALQEFGDLAALA